MCKMWRIGTHSCRLYCCWYGRLSHIPTTKRSRRDQNSPEKKKSLTTVANHMWCDKCGVFHPQNEPCRYPDVSKSLCCSTCGGQHNDHVRGCAVEKGTSILQICKKCEGEGHIQENCTTTGVPCYKYGKMGHLAGNVLKWEGLPGDIKYMTPLQRKQEHFANTAKRRATG